MSFRELSRAVTSCLSRRAMDVDSLPKGARNEALTQVLDGAPPGVDEMVVEDSADPSTNADTPSTLFEEQQARAAAEADAENNARRLSVCQEQLAEYAQSKHREVTKLRTEGDSLQVLVQRLVTTGGADKVLLQELQDQSRRLSNRLSEADSEAKAFYDQARTDANQANSLASVAESSDVRMLENGKRQRSDFEQRAETLSLSESPAGHPGADEGAVNGAVLAPLERPLGPAPTEMAERARWIPLRLSLKERKSLRLLEAALQVSEYTDKVDVINFRSKTQRMHTQIKDICAILSGLVVASDYKMGQNLVTGKTFSDNAKFFQDVFEAGRRHKVMNPEKMRAEYGKLVYMLMDSQLPEVQQLLEFQCVRPLRTTHSLLQERGALKLLDDEFVPIATAEISAEGKPRAQVQKEIKAKERARDALARKYASATLSEDEIRLVLYSIGDNNSFLASNRQPVDKCIQYLTQYFKPDTFEDGLSLAISGGLSGARLTHNHDRQYTYVLQSLTLWSEIANDMFHLWCLAEDDLLRENNCYRLTDTGQGLNRVQQAPKVSAAMHRVLGKCQRQLGHWVGSSVVHLGDHNVPNALMFIDKYTQVPRILNPLVLVVQQIPDLLKDPALRAYVDATFGGEERLRKEILADFFRHAFDGSGADNFFDAGSCIDGRLTSAWNWCSKIEKKAYYPVFKLCGFTGFDGDWQK